MAETSVAGLYQTLEPREDEFAIDNSKNSASSVTRVLGRLYARWGWITGDIQVSEFYCDTFRYQQHVQ